MIPTIQSGAMKLSLLLVLLVATWTDTVFTPTKGGINPYTDFEPPSETRDRANFKLITDNIQHRHYKAAQQTVASMLKRYSCSYMMRKLYQRDDIWFSKLVKFGTVDNDNDQSGCLLRGLVDAIIRNSDSSSVDHVNQTVMALTKTIQIYDTNYVPKYQTVGVLRDLEGHAKGPARDLIRSILKSYVTFDIPDKRREVIYQIQQSRFFESSIQVEVLVFSPEIGDIMDEVYDKRSKNLDPILRFMKQFTDYYELFHETVVALINHIMIPNEITDPDVVGGVLQLIQVNDVENKDMREDIKHETQQIIRTWLRQLKPDQKLKTYLDKTGMNLTKDQIKYEVVKDIQNMDYKGAQIKLFDRLSDVEYFEEIPKVFELLNIDKPENFERLLNFTFELRTTERAFVIVQALVLPKFQTWKDGERSDEDMDLLRVLQVQKTVVEPRALPSVVSALGTQFGNLITRELKSHFKPDSRIKPSTRGLEYLAEWFQSSFKTHFWLFLLHEVGTGNRSFVLDGVENFPMAEGALLMYTTILEHDRDGYDLLRVAFGLKNAFANFTGALADTDYSMLHRRLPSAAWSIIKSKVCLVHLEQNTFLAVDKFAASFDSYRREVGLFLRLSENIAAKWNIIRPNIRENVYYIQNDELKEYLIASVMDYSQDRRKVFTWRPSKETDNGKWTLELVGDNVIIKNIQWGEYLFGGKLNGRGVVYTWRNKTRTYPNMAVTKKRVKQPDVWRVAEC